MPRRDLSKGERTYDAWFRAQSPRRRAELRKAGLAPHCEEPMPDNVFPVIDEHPAFGVQQPDEPEAEVTLTQSFVSQDELRFRLRLLFDVLGRYADERTADYLAFIRSLLGEPTEMRVSTMAKRFGVTQQCMMWRARQIRAALGDLVVEASRRQSAKPAPRKHPQAGYKPRTVRDTHDDEL